MLKSRKRAATLRVRANIMLSFLSAEAIYGLLLVTTFASVGLVGMWAATSRWHTFLQTTIVLAILS